MTETKKAYRLPPNGFTDEEQDRYEAGQAERSAQEVPPLPHETAAEHEDTASDSTED